MDLDDSYAHSFNENTIYNYIFISFSYWNMFLVHKYFFVLNIFVHYRLYILYHHYMSFNAFL